MRPLLTLTILIFTLSLPSCRSLIMNQGFKDYKSDMVNTTDYKKSNNYQQDLLYLNDLAINAFPEINKVFPENDRKIMLDSLLNLLAAKEVKDQEFIGYARYYLAQFENQHTSIAGLKSGMLFPYELHFVGSNWYLWDIHQKYDSVLIGRQIVEINDEPIEKIEKSLFSYVFAENDINKRNKVRHLLNRPDILKQFGIIGQTDSISISFAKEENIWVKSVTQDHDVQFHLGGNKYVPHAVTRYNSHHYNIDLYPDENFAYFQFNRSNDKIDAYETMPHYLKPWIIPMAKSYLNRQIRKKNSQKTGGYVDVDRPVFKEYLSVMFDSLNTQGIENLVIDLRNNPGGSTLLCLQLLYYLTDQKDLKDFSKWYYLSNFQQQANQRRYDEFVKSYKLKNNAAPEKGKLYPDGFHNCDSLLFERIENPQSVYYIPQDRSLFKGKVIVLANYGTGSAAALFTTLLQDNGLAEVIGTSVGNNPIGATTHQPFKLPNSKFSGSIATDYLTRPDPSKGKFQTPDYWVENNVDDLIQGRDQLFEQALKLMQE